MKDFIVVNRQIADTCNFGKSLGRMLRDRIVCGLLSPGIHKGLLARSSPTLKEAEEAALSSELAALSVKRMEQDTVALHTSDGVHAVRREIRSARQKTSPKSLSNKAPTSSTRFGDSARANDDCPFRNAVCRRCKKGGHLERKGRSKRRHRTGTAAHCRRAHLHVHSEDDEEELFAIQSDAPRIGSAQQEKPLWRTFDCGGVNITMQLDTGATVSLVTFSTYLKHKDDWPELCQSDLRLSSFLGKLPIQGELHLWDIEPLFLKLHVRCCAVSCSTRIKGRQQ